MKMINLELSEDEFNLILNYRQGKYKIDISEEEYNVIKERRSLNNTGSGRYILNIDNFLFDDNEFIKQSAKHLKQICTQLVNLEISIEDYDKIDNYKNDSLPKEKLNLLDNLNYIKEQVSFHFKIENK